MFLKYVNNYKSFILCLLIVNLVFIFEAPLSKAQDLPEIALLHKCYAHITGTRMPLNHSLITAVKNKTKTAQQACEELLDNVMLVNGMINQSTTEIAKDADLALNHLTLVNRGKFGSINFKNNLAGAESYEPGVIDLFDSNMGGLVFTEALLNPNRNFSEVFTFGRVPQAQRSLSVGSKFIQNSAYIARNVLRFNATKAPNYSTNYTQPGYLDSVIFPDLQINPTSGTKFNVINLSNTTALNGFIVNFLDFPDSFAPTNKRIQIGQLQGIIYSDTYSLRFPSDVSKDSYFKSSNGTTLFSPLDLRMTIDKNLTDSAGSSGSGLIGTQEYLMLNFAWDREFKADGLINMPRRWAQSVFKDLLCRDLPVVRESDSTHFVVDTSLLNSTQKNEVPPFRLASSCTTCHSTMDQMAATLRNVTWHSPPFDSGTNAVGSSIRLVKWPVISNYTGVNSTIRDYAVPSGSTAFNQLPPIGQIFFRSYDGRLYDIPVNDLKDLSLKLSQLDDPYVCAAKQYFKQLTNIDVSLHDIGDPAQALLNKSLTKEDWEARDFVIQLGLELKIHQKPAKTFKAILNSKYFKTNRAALAPGGT